MKNMVAESLCYCCAGTVTVLSVSSLSAAAVGLCGKLMNDSYSLHAGS